MPSVLRRALLAPLTAAFLCAAPAPAQAWVPPTPPQCADGIDNDLDGAVDHGSDDGCVNVYDDDEGDLVTCAPYGAPVCVSVEPVSDPWSLAVAGPAVTVEEQDVRGWLYVYAYDLPTGGAVNVACAELYTGEVGLQGCLDGGRLVDRSVLVDETMVHAYGDLSGTLTTVRICHADVTVTVAGVGIERFPATTLC